MSLKNMMLIGCMTLGLAFTGAIVGCEDEAEFETNGELEVEGNNDLGDGLDDAGEGIQDAADDTGDALDDAGDDIGDTFE